MCPKELRRRERRKGRIIGSHFDYGTVSILSDFVPILCTCSLDIHGLNSMSGLVSGTSSPSMIVVVFSLSDTISATMIGNGMLCEMKEDLEGEIRQAKLKLDTILCTYTLDIPEKVIPAPCVEFKPKKSVAEVPLRKCLDKALE